MHDGPPIESNISEAPEAPAPITLEVAFAMLPTTFSSRSPTPWKVSRRPSPIVLIINECEVH